MPFKLTCPGCNTVWNLPDAARGKKGRCKKCGGTLDASAPPPDAGNGTAPAASPNSGARIALIAIAGVVGVSVCCCGGGGVGGWYLLNRGVNSAVVVLNSKFDQEMKSAKEQFDKDFKAAETRITPPPETRVQTPPPETRVQPPPTKTVNPPPPTKTVTPPATKKVPPPALVDQEFGKLAELIVGRWAFDNNFHFQYHADGKVETPNIFGKFDSQPWSVENEVTLVQGTLKRKVVFWSKEEFSFFFGDRPNGKEQRYQRLGPTLFGGIKEARVIPGGGDQLAMSPDGKTLAVTRHNLVVLFDPATGEEKAQLKDEGARVGGIAFADAKTLIGGTHGHHFRFWDVAEAKQTHILSGQGILNTVAVTPDGKLLVGGGFDPNLHFVDVASHKAQPVVAVGQDVHYLAFAPDGKHLAVGSGLLRVYQLPERTVKFSVKASDREVRGVSFSPDGKTLAAGGTENTFGNVVTLWNVETGQQLSKFKPYKTGETRHVAYAPDGKQLAVAVGKWVRLWDVAANKEGPLLIGHLHDVSRVAWTPDSKQLISTSGDRITIWEMPEK